MSSCRATNAKGRFRYGIQVLGECYGELRISDADRDILPAARNALPALLARVRELEAAKQEQTAIIGAGRAAHSEDRARADWLARDRDSVLAELRALRAVAEAASDMATVHLDFAIGGPADNAGAAVSLYQLRAALEAWRGSR